MAKHMRTKDVIPLETTYAEFRLMVINAFDQGMDMATMRGGAASTDGGTIYGTVVIMPPEGRTDKPLALVFTDREFKTIEEGSAYVRKFTESVFAEELENGEAAFSKL